MCSFNNQKMDKIENWTKLNSLTKADIFKKSDKIGQKRSRFALLCFQIYVTRISLRSILASLDPRLLAFCL